MNELTDRKYKNPPIVEALVDIRVAPSTPRDYLEIVDDFSKRITPRYPKRVAINSPLLDGTVAMMGVRFLDNEEFKAVDISPTQYVYRVRKYVGWEVFEPDAKSCWSEYAEWVGDCKITRIAVRYTNRFDIKIELAKGDPLFHPSITDPLEKNENLLTYALHTMIFQPDLQATVSLQRGIVPPNKADEVSIVLDIDVFRDLDDSQILSSANTVELWDIIDSLHVCGKKYFEKSITDKVRQEINK